LRRREDLFMPPVVLERASSEALHIQIYRQVAAAIPQAAAGQTRLPSTRMWAALLGVSRNTVLAAYDELSADGLIEGSHGAGMFLRAGFHMRPGSLIRAAHFPERTALLPDPDGNPLYINF
jgi:GntR family transcriptional regulator/MocR family aminotransferase